MISIFLHVQTSIFLVFLEIPKFNEYGNTRNRNPKILKSSMFHADIYVHMYASVYVCMQMYISACVHICYMHVDISDCWLTCMNVARNT